MSAPLVETAFCCLNRICHGRYRASTRCMQQLCLVRRHCIHQRVVSPSFLHRSDFSMRRYAISLFSCCCRHIATSKAATSSVRSVSTLCPLRTTLGGASRKVLNSVSPVRLLHTSSVHLAKHSLEYRRRTTTMYVIAIGVLIGGGSYAAVPLYRMFCQATGIGGQAGLLLGEDAVGKKIENLQKVPERLITVRFNADTAASMRWAFRPQQTQIKVYPGETALAFYTATNPTDKPVTGISTYNIIPFEAALYFNKIQCFCFEEQLLNPHEQVDMPVFFYIDPDYVQDPKMENVDTIILSYTFFEAKEGLELPSPY